MRAQVHALACRGRKGHASSQCVGDGDIAFEPLFCGLDMDDHHYIVERDTAPDAVANPAGSFSKRSYAYLTSLRERRGGRRHH